ncbi:MAG: aldehyde dehydrogenase family protein [Bradymonadaceae bacterium]|nr:aldehyde dehydrogenase family protein [Lujinxingiaceae bacterium]
MLNNVGRASAPVAELRLDTITCMNPATQHVIGEVSVTSREAMVRALQQAGDAQRSWRRLEIGDRVRCLQEAREKLMDHRQELLDLISEETGKPRPDAMAELLNLFDTMSYYLSNASQMLDDHKLNMHLLRNKRGRVEYSPLGVVLNISPWNFPLDLAISPAIPALLAGNAVIIKPSQLTPLVALAAANIINDSGLPRGLLQVLPGYGDLGEELAQRVDGIVFTGTTKNGRTIGRIAGERLIPCILELGSKDAMVVLNDADLERSAHGAVWGAFSNAGQSCLSIERAYVQEDVYEDFVARVSTLTRQLRQGDPISPTIDVGAITNPEHIFVLEEHVADAVKRGAKLLTGGKRVAEVDGHYFEPTVLIDVTDDMLVMREQSFGPILPIMMVRSPAEAIQRVNDLPYGLGASVWSKNTDVAHEVARQLDVGGVCINDVLVHYLAVEAPFGGNKSSGLGRRKGLDELRTFTNSKTVIEDILQLKREPFWYPYNQMIETALDKALVMLYRKGITKKVADLFSRH